VTAPRPCSTQKDSVEVVFDAQGSVEALLDAKRHDAPTTGSAQTTQLADDMVGADKTASTPRSTRLDPAARRAEVGSLRLSAP
jgi:hypothetical protein